MRGRWLLPLLVAVAAFLLFRFARGYPWPMALVAATAVGALLYTTRGIWGRLVGMHRHHDRFREQKRP